MMEVTISIDMNKKCSKCKELGATQNGLCIKCMAMRIKMERIRREAEVFLRSKEVRDEVPLC